MDAEFEVVLPGDAATPARLRRSLAAWLRARCGRERLCETCEDVVLAVNEAVTNCVDHAYGTGPDGGPVTVHGVVDDLPDRPLPAPLLPDRGSAADVARAMTGAVGLTMSVADEGRWRPPPADPGNRGRGLSMIRACVDDVDIVCTDAGTTVTLRQVLGCSD
ncbi:MAG: ATP-binding protein [Pseudonocardia sp.]|nr:ATP-binding protein [Pseudonocardia sp.]